MKTEKNNSKTIFAWCLYDWANSVYSLTITTAIFPLYFAGVTRAAAIRQEGNDFFLSFGGFEIQNSVLYSYSLSFAFLFIAFLNPLLSGIADYSGRKKMFMRFFSILGSVSCMALFFFDSTHIWIGILFFITATIGYAGSLVFYNAYLPEIATPENYDKISAKGFSMGYIGSVLLLVVNILMTQMPELFFLKDDAEASRYSFLSVGIWWFVFSTYTFKLLPSDNKQSFSANMLTHGYNEMKKVWNEIQNLPALRNFLIAFFLYMMGFQTIMYLATLFGSEELHIPTSGLIATILIIQLVAIAGAYLFSYLSKKRGNIFTLTIAVCIAIGVCIGAYLTTTQNQFYALAFVVGLIMGGIQSLSRSTYSKLLTHTEDHASYFSFYELTDKVGTAAGTAVFGFINARTGSMKNSLFALLLFFVLSIYFLYQTKSKYADIVKKQA